MNRTRRQHTVDRKIRKKKQAKTGTDQWLIDLRTEAREVLSQRDVNPQEWTDFVLDIKAKPDAWDYAGFVSLRKAPHFRDRTSEFAARVAAMAGIALELEDRDKVSFERGFALGTAYRQMVTETWADIKKQTALSKNNSEVAQNKSGRTSACQKIVAEICATLTKPNLNSVLNKLKNEELTDELIERLDLSISNIETQDEFVNFTHEFKGKSCEDKIALRTIQNWISKAAGKRRLPSKKPVPPAIELKVSHNSPSERALAKRYPKLV